MKSYFVFFIILIGFLISSCANSSITIPYITVADQNKLKLGMKQDEVLKLIGYPLEISVGQDSSKSITYAFWTYFLRYPVYYPGFNPVGNKDVSIGKTRVIDQMLQSPLATYAEEQEHKLVFVDGILTAFGNKEEISSLSIFSIKPPANGSK
jgi:hypothetical protein